MVGLHYVLGQLSAPEVVPHLGALDLNCLKSSKFLRSIHNRSVPVSLLNRRYTFTDRCIEPSRLVLAELCYGQQGNPPLSVQFLLRHASNSLTLAQAKSDRAFGCMYLYHRLGSR